MKSQIAGIRSGVALLLLFAWASLASTGCQIVRRGDGKPNTMFGSAKAAEQPVAADGPTYRIEVAPDKGKVRSSLEPLTPGMTLQQAIDRSGAARHLDNLDVEVIRIDPASKQQIKMGAEFGGKKKRLLPNYDYALHPNDRIVIKEDKSNILKTMLGQLSSFGRG